jgi:hypothetical protein
MPISQEEYAAIRDAKAGLLRLLAIEETFDLVIENYLEFEAALLQAALSSLARRDPPGQRSSEERALFDRRLLNLLAAVKSYVDQVPKHVVGVRPQAAAIVNATLDDERQTRLGLRAMLALRNVVQHHDSLVHLVAYGSKLPGGVLGAGVAFTVDPYVLPEDLGTDPGMHKHDKLVLDELRALGPKVELKPLVRECVEGLWAVHSVTRSEVGSSNQELETVLRAAETRYLTLCPEQETALALAAIKREPGEDPSEEVQIVWGFTGYRKYLETKNSALEGIARRYVTSEAANAKP